MSLTCTSLWKSWFSSDSRGALPAMPSGSGSHAAIDGKWVPLVLAILSLAPYGMLVLPDDRVFPPGIYSDYSTYQVPIREFAREEILAGRFPLWVPYLGAGLPLHAGQQAALAYPLLTPFIVFFPVNYGIRLALVLHLVLCWWGQFRLSRALGASRLAAGLAASIATQSAFVMTHLMEGHVNLVLAYALIPWFLLVLVRHLRSSSATTALSLALIVAGSILTGHPQVPYYMLLAGGAWGIASLVAGAGATQRLRCLLWTALAACFAMGLVLIQFLPTLELMWNNSSVSGRGTAEYASAYSLEWIDLLRYVFPNLRGNRFLGVPEFPTFSFFHERSGYVGLISLLLTSWRLTRTTADRLDVGCFVLIAVALLIGLGGTTPVFKWLGPALPGIHYFRCPGRILSIVSILIAILAGRGLDSILRGDPAAQRTLTAVVLGTFWIGMNVVVLTDMENHGTELWESLTDAARSRLTRDLAVSLAIGATGVVLAALSHRIPSWNRHRVAVLIVTLSLIDLGYFNAACLHLVPPTPQGVPDDVAAIDPPIRFLETGEGGKIMAANLRYCRGVAGAIQSHRTILGTNEGGVLPAATERLFEALERSPRVALAASACDYLCDRGMTHWQPVVRPLPRCRFSSGTDAVSISTPLDQLADADLKSNADELRVDPKIVRETSQSVEIELNAPGPGMVVLADTAYPGWQAFVNGTLTEIETVHSVFRGVRVPSGWSRVRFEYRPSSFRFGLAGSLLAGMAVLSLRVSEKFQQRRRTSRHESSQEAGLCAGDSR